MDIQALFQSDNWWFVYVILPVLIFAARITDQSIGTLRLIFVAKGFKYLAPLVGFFESIIWLLAVSQIMKHLDNWVAFVAYGGGFAMGNYFGMVLEEKISIGKVLVRIIPKKDTTDLMLRMKEENYGMTTMEAMGATGPVTVIMSIINRKDLPNLMLLINHFNPNAFYTIEDVKSVKEGVFPMPARRRLLRKNFGPKKVK
jgi:uncharacterized protein YebE (UPF0316 family)